MPVRVEPYPIYGVNLHPFFAGLLPEGVRMRALVRAVKTSEDDLFSLLMASGGDTVGDVTVSLPGKRPKERAPVADLGRITEVSFDQLLEQSLRYGQGGGDVSFAGVQPKVSAAMISLPIRAKEKGRCYILKLAPSDYPKLVENEAFFMVVAKSVGIDVARVRLEYDKNKRPGLLIERFDRIAQKDGHVLRVHQEDACQLLDRYPADKYRISLSEISSALEVCSAPIAERLDLLRMQAFSYLIVNGDMHARNVSVRAVGTRIELAPGYDLLSTLPYGDHRLALSMEGRDENIKRGHFIAFGQRVGIRRAAVEHMLDSLCKRIAPWLSRLHEIDLDPKPFRHLERTMRKRLVDLVG